MNTYGKSEKIIITHQIESSIGFNLSLNNSFYANISSMHGFSAIFWGPLSPAQQCGKLQKSSHEKLVYSIGGNYCHQL